MCQTLWLVCWTYVGLGWWGDERPAAVAAQNAAQTKGAAAADPADQALMAWFDTLGFPDLAQRKFGRVVTQDESKLDLSFGPTRRGFLLSEDEQSLTVFTLDFDTIVVQKKTPPVGRIKARTSHFEVQDLEQDVTRWLDELSKLDEDERPNRFYRKSSGRSEAVLLARVCLASGLGKVAHRLIEQAAAMRPDHGGKPAGRDGLQAELADDIAHTVMWLNVVALGQPAVSRPELLRRFRHFTQKFPASKHLAQAQEILKVLERMVQEDTEHEKQKKPFNQLTPKERVAELIYQLRDQNGRQMSQPGSCDIFQDPRDEGRSSRFLDFDGIPPGVGSPATQLVVIGYEAVPQLIEHLDDVTLTRSVTYGRDFFFSHEALRVSDCAQFILQRISGRRFSGQNGARWYAEQWWADFQKKGEKQMLLEGTIAGTDWAPHQAERLLKKYPDVAFDAITQGAKNAGSPHVRSSLIFLSTKVKGKPSTEYLLNQLKTGPDLQSRATAASLLADQKHPDVIPAMIREWEQLPEGKPDLFGGFRSRDGSEQVIGLLVRSENVEAIQALAKGLDQRPMTRRFEVILAMRAFRRGKPPAVVPNAPADDPGPSSAVRDAVEELLTHSLDDVAGRQGASGSFGETSYRDPRVCDMAGYMLTTLWPNEYKFDLGALPIQRDRQLVLLKNVWRAKQKLPALPVPEPKAIPRLPDAQTKPLIVTITETASDADRKKATEELLALGLQALPAVIDALQALPADHPGRSALSAVSSRLGCIVRDVKLETGSIQPDAAFRNLVTGLRGKPLSLVTMVEFLKAAINAPPQKHFNLTFIAERAEDLDGINLTVTVTEGPMPDPNNLPLPGANWSERVELNRKTICASSTSGSYLTYRGDPKHHKRADKSIDEALNAAANVPFLIQIKINVDR